MQPEQKSANRAVVMVKESKATWIVAITLVVIALTIILMGLFGLKGSDTKLTGLDEDRYQAVFLTNGQVYFGNLSQPNSDYVRLTDIYYLNASQAPQPKNEESDAAAGDEGQQLELVKLGNELHGPQDEMQIASDQMLFWENLKDDGKVVQAIKNNQSSPGTQNDESN